MISKMNMLLLTLVSISLILSIIVLMKDNKKENLDAIKCVSDQNEELLDYIKNVLTPHAIKQGHTNFPPPFLSNQEILENMDKIVVIHQFKLGESPRFNVMIVKYNGKHYLVNNGYGTKHDKYDGKPPCWYLNNK